jgi:aspartyl-tRNA(Asn)/glutamyl-tRNA(Gln) amidotransferase subunit C
MSLTEDQVRHVARLSRLALTPDELARMTRELAAVLGHMDALRAVDTTAVPPTRHIDPPTDPWREDEPAVGLARDTMLAAAPEAREGQVRVPRILEEAP